MTEVVKRDLEDKLRYERALYRIHEVDDPALKEHFNKIVKDYEKSHPKKCVNCSCHKLSAKER